MARRLRADGTPLDAAPWLLGSGFAPSVAFNGTTLLVTFSGGDIVGKRFDRDGNALGGDPIAINPDWGYGSRVASNGEDFLVVWSFGSDFTQWDPPNRVDVMAARVSASGEVLDPTPIAIAATKADEVSPALASNGRDYLVAYASGPQITGQYVQRDGTMAGPPFAIGAAQAGWRPAIAVAGDALGYWVAWDGTMRLARVDAHGVELFPEPLAVGSGPALLGTGGDGAELAYARDVEALTSKVVTRAIAAHGRARAAGR